MLIIYWYTHPWNITCYFFSPTLLLGPTVLNLNEALRLIIFKKALRQKDAYKMLSKKTAAQELRMSRLKKILTLISTVGFEMV